MAGDRLRPVRQPAAGNPFDRVRSPSPGDCARSSRPRQPARADLGTTALGTSLPIPRGATTCSLTWRSRSKGPTKRRKAIRGRRSTRRRWSRRSLPRRYLTGNPLDQERAATAAASGRLGAMAPIVQGATVCHGAGRTRPARGSVKRPRPGSVAANRQWAGGVLGSAAEGAGAERAGRGRA